MSLHNNLPSSPLQVISETRRDLIGSPDLSRLFDSTSLSMSDESISTPLLSPPLSTPPLPSLSTTPPLSAPSSSLEPPIPPISEKQIRIDVGGYKFSTTLTTLTADPDSMLAAMFSGRFPTIKNPEGYIFIDRDGQYFHHILNWLRNGTLPPIEHQIERESLLLEAKYYHISSLADFVMNLDATLEDKTNNRASQFSVKEFLKLVNTVPSRRKLQLASANLTGLSLDGISLPAANLKFCKLDQASLQYSTLSESMFQGASLNYADLQHADLQLCQFMKCRMQYAKLNNANLSNANLMGADLTGCDLQGANLQGANLQDAILQGANVQYTNLLNAKLQGASLHGITNVHHAKGLKR
eukprot:TRINITY_DN4342_c0_g1_i4.p1 TRINITY_DN4342_c0_g1~~TRINITY_DN4342_c0_g1_i4.p1  ORF type:complete len:379 (+),score=106.28 TRINITY_DN4342_c0_g1_i4:73-1137(+)